MKKPNILFILIDDMGFADLTCSGSTFYETPNIDKIAMEGIRFNQAYSASPVCSPTRASILCGKYPVRTGVTSFIGGAATAKLTEAPYEHGLSHKHKTIAKSLKENGYNTWHIGKWHLGDKAYYPTTHGFDLNLGGCDWGLPMGGYFSPYKNEMLEDGPDGEYLTDRLTDEAIKLINNSGDTPFFLNLWHYAVHVPIKAADENVVNKYKQKAIDMGIDGDDVFEVGKPFPIEHKKNRRLLRRIVQSDPYYAAMIENLDDNIGRLLDALEKTGKLDETLIIFTSDNGGLSTSEGCPTVNIPFREGKGWLEEGGVRVPLLIRYPKLITPNVVSSSYFTSPDFYPTILEAAEIPLEPESHIDGVSFLNALKSEPFSRGPIFWHFPHYGNQGSTPCCSMRSEDYILIHMFEDSSFKLYNITIDPCQSNDLSIVEPKILETMKVQLNSWLSNINAILPTRNDNFKQWEVDLTINTKTFMMKNFLIGTFTTGVLIKNKGAK